MPGRPVALTIAGSDPSGGAGLQADLKVFHQFGVYGEAAVTVITVQNTVKVSSVHCLPADLVAAQIEAVVSDIRPQAAKTGALGNREIVEAIARSASEFDFPLVVDPVMASEHGVALLVDDARQAVIRLLLPRAFLLTPNLPEATALSGIDVKDLPSMREAARILADAGAKSVLVKGGHLADDAVDVLHHDGSFLEFPALRVHTRHTHGTGCSYSAAITAGLALGAALPDAIASAKSWLTRAITTNPGLGAGSGPVNHHALLA